MQAIFETPLYPYTKTADEMRNSPTHHPVIIIGAGPVGLAVAIDLAQSGQPCLVLDDNDKVSFGSRAICFAKRPLEILDRLGCGDKFVEKGVQWNLGKVFFDERQVYDFNLLPEEGHHRPAFINLQQYYAEKFLVDRAHELITAGMPLELRGKNKITNVSQSPGQVLLEIETPEGQYQLTCDWLIACDGANSTVRHCLGAGFLGRSFEDNFLIADVRMQADFPTERWFWFDPPFNREQSALLHKQPDGVWRIDLQLGWNIDREAEMAEERVIGRLKTMLGETTDFELEWVSIYSFQCRRMEKFHHGRVIFAGDSAHQLSPFGARGANSGLQDADNLAWKLHLVLKGLAPVELLESYDDERILAADENILNSTRSTDFITPKSPVSKLFRDAVLNLSEKCEFARPLVNSGRLSVPSIYDNSPLNGTDCVKMPARTRPGAPAVDAPVPEGWLLNKLGGGFQLLCLGVDAPAPFSVDGIEISIISELPGKEIQTRYLGTAKSACYLIRPDQHVAARWEDFDKAEVEQALRRAIGKTKCG